MRHIDLRIESFAIKRLPDLNEYNTDTWQGDPKARDKRQGDRPLKALKALKKVILVVFL